MKRINSLLQLKKLETHLKASKGFDFLHKFQKEKTNDYLYTRFWKPWIWF